MRLYDLLPEIYKDKETEKFWDILQAAIDEIELSAEDIKNLIDIDKAREDWLVNIASNLGVDLSKDFPVSNRAKISKAIDLYKLAGTKEGLKLILDLLEVQGEIKEWFQYNGDPYKFKLYMQSVVDDPNIWDKLINLVNEYKNLRSHLETIGIHREYNDYIYFGDAIKDGKKYNIHLHIETNIPDSYSYIAGAVRIANKAIIGINQPGISIQNSSFHVGSTIRTAKKLTIGVA